MIDFIFLIDIIISFRTVFIDDITGEEKKEDWAMALHYIKTTFIIDIAATVPFD